MIVREVYVKTILSKSKVYDYTINPYIGCEYGCTYCYARFMKRYTGHKEAWGDFVDVKVNACSLLQREVKKKSAGRVWVSGVCDPYQPLERRYELTRSCLEILLEHGWLITIQTKSPLVLRDLESLKRFSQIEVGLTITTADEDVKELFEPNSPPIKQRIETLEQLHSMGIKTFAMIAPVLPKAENLVSQIKGIADYVLIDRMNYHHADWVYKKYGLAYAMTNNFFTQKKTEFANAFENEDVPYQLLY